MSTNSKQVVKAFSEGAEHKCIFSAEMISHMIALGVKCQQCV